MELSSTIFRKIDLTAIQSQLIIESKTKKAVIYLVLMIITTLIIGALCSAALKWDVTEDGTRIFYCMSLFLTGLLHAFMIPKWFKESKQIEVSWDILYSILIAVLIFLFHLLLFFTTGFFELSWLLSAIIGFFLPTAVRFTWLFFNAIDEVATYPPWQLPEVIPERKASLLLNAVELKICTRLKPYDRDEKIFRVTAPKYLLLGELFHRFVSDQYYQLVNIELFDQDQEAFAWRFILKTSIGEKILDPAATITKNKIRKGYMIIAERVEPKQH